MRRLVIATALAALAATAALAQGDPVDQREALFKEWGRATRPVGEMLKGDAAFDLAKVQAALDVYVKNAKVLPGLFPPGATGNAQPAVWSRNDEFKALFAKFEQDATAARGAITDEASFKANFPSVVRTCGTCHETFRVKK